MKSMPCMGFISDGELPLHGVAWQCRFVCVGAWLGGIVMLPGKLDEYRSGAVLPLNCCVAGR
jgi:hypothetical protein